MDFDKEVDLSGLNCPLPILRTKAALAKMAPGEVLKIVVTNNDSVREIQALAEQSGATLNHRQEESGKHLLLFEKS